jgi:hypothetical protein
MYGYTLLIWVNIRLVYFVSTFPLLAAIAVTVHEAKHEGFSRNVELWVYKFATYEAYRELSQLYRLYSCQTFGTEPNNMQYKNELLHLHTNTCNRYTRKATSAVIKC